MTPWFSCCFSANGIRFLGILLPPGLRLPSRSVYGLVFMHAYECPDDVADVPDVDVHARQHPPAAEPECDELLRLGVPRKTTSWWPLDSRWPTYSMLRSYW